MEFPDEFPDEFTLTVLPEDFEGADFFNGGLDLSRPTCPGHRALARTFQGQRVLMGYCLARVGIDPDEDPWRLGHEPTGTRYEMRDEDDVERLERAALLALSGSPPVAPLVIAFQRV